MTWPPAEQRKLLHQGRSQLQAEQAEDWSKDLRGFLEAAWPHVVPRGRFVPGWHIDAICDHLQAVTDGDIRRLIISVPPGSTKSTIASICWPAWEWTTQPYRRYITASYVQRLATRLAVKSRDLIRSDWYQARWGHMFAMKVDEDMKTEFANDQGGRRLAIGAGTGTGEHGDVIVIDDPHDAEEILSDAEREAVMEWHDGTITTRFTDSAEGAEVIIAQRLHEKDLIGHVLALEPGTWEHLCLPERYEVSHPHRTPAKVKLTAGREVQGDPRTAEGELLCEERIDDLENAKRQTRLGSFRSAGQLQQRPAAREGEILKRSGWRYFPAWWLEKPEYLPKFQLVVQSWDTAFKDRTVNDYVAGGLWGKVGADLYLIDSRVERLGLTKTKEAIRAMTAYTESLFPRLPHWVLVEKSANGVEILAELRREIRGLVPINASTSKVARAEAAEPALEAGNIYIPGAAAPELPSGYDPAATPAFAQSLVETCAAFPHGEHDDEVDMFTQVVNWSRGKSTSKAVLGIAQGKIPKQGRLAGVR